MVNNVDFNKLEENQKVNYVKNLLFNSDLTKALDVLLQYEKKDLKIIKIILSVLDEDLIINRIKEQCNLTDLKQTKSFVYSKIISILEFYKKTVILNSFFKLMNEGDRKQIATYEYQNKTNVSFNSKIFNKYCLKYKEEVLKDFKLDDEEIHMLDEEKERYNALSDKKIKRKVHVIPTFLTIALFLITLIFGYKLYDYNKIISKYDGLFIPGIYLNDVDLAGMKTSDIKKVVLSEKERIQNGTITVTNVNGDYKFTYEEIGIEVNDDNLADEIKSYNKNLSFFKKVRFIKSNKKSKTFYLKVSYDEEVIDNLMDILKDKLNTTPRNDGMVIDDNYNVYYDKGASGFTLDVEKTKDKVKEAFANLKEETVIQVEGTVVPNEIKHEKLSSINKKISSYTTYFVNAGNRGHNINLASRRLNDTILMPGETFSYLKVVGPYGASNGYLPAPIYLNGSTSTANGGGVCQLASTLYNAQLRVGLETVSRRGHTFAPNYVPKGLDATVYSTTTDYKFKNNHKYPIYIVSYVKGNYLTVDIWSNENALEGKTYEPYSVASNGGWLAYLKTIQDGKVIETKYLDKSVYKAH